VGNFTVAFANFETAVAFAGRQKNARIIQRLELFDLPFVYGSRVVSLATKPLETEHLSVHCPAAR
jgi:hypothetical protein